MTKCLKKIESCGHEYYPREAAQIGADAINQLAEYSNKLEWRVEELEKELEKVKAEYNTIVENIDTLICNLEKQNHAEKFVFLKKYRGLEVND